MRVVIEELNIRRDERGTVFEPLEAAHLPEQRNVYVVLTEPGCIRANHYHRRGTEVVTVSGEMLVRFRDGGRVEARVVPEGKVVKFRFPSGVSHAFQNTGEKSNVLVYFNTEVHDEAEPDVVRDVLIEEERSGVRD